MIYRYYRKPTTRRALTCVRRLIEDGKLVPSEIVSIRGGYTVRRWYRFSIRTKTHQFQFTGFAWFYHGEGPRGLQQVLKWLLLPDELVEQFVNMEHHGDTYRPNSICI
ncbi:hypothetical protein [Paenibacillus apiarius]|uniref:Uncharacterized protein n=1 Tax=Paenibacillus apiarius TaxID=46240 RepID=A0ABT4E4L5_9BACL|nr:hypothetical protein [Paenibacillus apiarius]MCY9517004.1 hypothetical protein [Paenibacillus apiarius]MCY9523288.1 hypothetical protein [Paenibacillus apiarius]MCY9554214.1 hypothetical protein [Paenibacillus apiarius]MCY9560825.1 hypothetical protein [Paenibacillus apiarius]MCY9682747.1 hypothetical protein [Paenibacillus apiarius]